MSLSHNLPYYIRTYDPYETGRNIVTIIRCPVEELDCDMTWPQYIISHNERM